VTAGMAASVLIEAGDTVTPVPVATVTAGVVVVAVIVAGAAVSLT
jgi:hypothetical protein